MISDEECLDTLRDAMQATYDDTTLPYHYLFWEMKDRKIISVTKTTDLIEEYAPKLFNVANPKELEEIITKWLKLIYEYGSAIPKQNLLNSMQGKAKIIGYEKKSKEEKIKVFRTKIEDITKLIHNNFSTNADIDELEKVLGKAYKNADNYFNSKPITEKDKNAISDYLVSLKLYGKSKEINNFIKALQH